MSTDTKARSSLQALGALGGSAETAAVRLALIESIARDLGKPLAMVQVAAIGLKKRRSGSGDIKDELVDIINVEAARLERFQATLLDMVKLQAGVLEVRPETVALKDIVKVAVRDAALALSGRHTDVNVSADLPDLRVDPALLRKALVILIEHAAGQTPEGLTVSVQATSDATAIWLQVLDEGEGIGSRDLASMFDQVHLLCDGDRCHSGAGMHLALCRGLIAAIGGQVTAANRSDRNGTVFTITLPLPQ